MNTYVHALALNKQIKLVEISSSNGTGFEIMSHREKLGTIYRETILYNVHYNLYDTQFNLESTAHFNVSSTNWDIKLVVLDSENTMIGSIWGKIFDFYATYKVYDKNESLIATSSSNFWNTIFNTYDDDSDNNDILATMHQSFLRSTPVSRWNIDITNFERIDAIGMDSRLLLMLFATQADRIFQQQITADFKRDEYRKNQDNIDLLGLNYRK